MRKLVWLVHFVPWLAYSQVTVTPSFPTAQQEITIVYDATQGVSGLVGASRVFMHSGAIVSGPTGTAWVNVKGTWGDPASVGEMAPLGNNKWTIKITPRTYFGVAAATRIYRVGMVFRSAGPCGGFSGIATPCQEGKTAANADIFVDLIEENQFEVVFTEPTSSPVFRNPGDQLMIVASSSKTANLKLKIDGLTVLEGTGVSSLSYSHTVSGSPGSLVVIIEADDGLQVKTASFYCIARAPTVVEARPAGIIDGINYSSAPSAATLCLWAPGKSSVYVVGDFTGWKIEPAFQLKQDGERFWLEIAGLTEGVEYAFQYLVDETVYIADPYADKILDPEDQSIPAASYPGLKPYPQEASHPQWYFNRLAVLQTGQAVYEWEFDDYDRPLKEGLVIYELLIRDFFESGKRNYQSLIDTLGYLKRLGVNAVELMPVMEFNGNEGWGYNPTFLFAPDKYYGTKNKLKEFIDKCHQRGIAVIVDLVMNHHDVPNPYAMMDFDFTAFKPTTANRWFNVTATHPFNVFYDMNHESQYTKKYLDTVNYYWLNEYKVDGFRYDLSKGFTQRNNPDNVTAWSNYDASRISLLKRMADKIWAHSPEALIILEHLGSNDEEKELAEYRSVEGKGMLLWGKMTDAYNQNSMGYSENSDISAVYHGNRGWSVPGLVGYMESHDEERLMFKNTQFGNASAAYSVKDKRIGLSRMIAASALFYTVPGPKMLWQFGELGYDYSINFCPGGNVSPDCRLSPKPVGWPFREDPARNQLYDHVRDLIRLRGSSGVFKRGIATIPAGTGLVKRLTLRGDPYVPSPSNADEMNVVVIVNFDVVSQNATVTFPHAGTWYDYYRHGLSFQANNSAIALTLKAGEYKLFTDYLVEASVVTETEGRSVTVDLYPNPVQDRLFVDSESAIDRISVVGMEARRINLRRHPGDGWDVSSLPPGLFVAEVTTGGAVHRIRILKY